MIGFAKRFASVAALLLLGAAVLVSAAKQPRVAPTALSAPALLWGSKPYFLTEESEATQRVNYQGVSHKQVAENLLGGLVKNAGPLEASAQRFLNKNLAKEDAPELLLVYVGSQAAATDLNSSNEDMAPVRDAAQRAASSLTLPYVYMDTTDSDFSASVISYLQGAINIDQPVKVEVTGACEAAQGADPAATLQAMQAAHVAGSLDVLVVCGVALEAGSEAALRAEASQVAELQALLSADVNYLVVYFVDPIPAASEMLENQQRSLLSQKQRGLLAITYEQWCAPDSVCFTQVKFIEAIILLLVLVTALLSGLTCSNMLDAPTRWETPSTES